MKIDHREKSIHRYLLGEMAESDQTAFERELLADRDKFDQVWSVEDELIDSYVRDEMSRSDRERFESHYLASPLHRERVAIARLFLENIDQPGGETINTKVTSPVAPWWSRLLESRSWPKPAVGAALALALLLIFGGGWLFIERSRLTDQIAKIQSEAQIESASLRQREQELALRNQELEKEMAERRRQSEQLKAEVELLRQQARSTLSAVPSFLLIPTPLRSENAPPPPAIPILNGKIRLLMELESRDHPSYRIKLQTAEGREILLGKIDQVIVSKDRAFAMLTIPAKTLAKGEYVLILSGQTPDGRSEEIDRYFFRTL
jgi:hypothetical protein